MIPKFRAWDKNTNDMVGVKTIDLEKDGSIGCIVDYNGINLDVSECILMQSTGLKDKNSVEIFEGDIIQGPIDFGPAGFDISRAVVKFNVEQGYKWEYWLIDKIEVIGNIYENPELLEKASEEDDSEV